MDAHARIVGAAKGCASLNNLYGVFFRSVELIDRIDRDRKSAEIAIVERTRGGSQMLWKATLETVDGGLSVVTAATNNYRPIHLMVPEWIHGRSGRTARYVTESFDFTVC